MPKDISEIKTIEDLEKISKAVLKSLDDGFNCFNPFQGSVVRSVDGTIMFMGSELTTHEALQNISKYVCNNRKKVSRHIRNGKRSAQTSSIADVEIRSSL